MELTEKRLQLLKEIVPDLSRVALLVNPNEPGSQHYASDAVSKAAPKLNLSFEPFSASSVEELAAVFNAMPARGIQAVLPSTGGFFYQQRATLAHLALAQRLPLCVWSRETLEAGALLSYGANYVDLVRRAPRLVDKILKGAKPAEIPVEQPNKYELLLNLKTATALGVNVPSILLQQAEGVIE